LWKAIDLHRHVLPGIDDGPGDLDGAIALGRAAVQPRTRLMAATPHVALAWVGKANARMHNTLRARPADRLAEEREAMRPLRASWTPTVAGCAGAAGPVSAL
jgi:Capsular polysaccharide synthesis, CpsB/CapC